MEGPVRMEGDRHRREEPASQVVGGEPKSVSGSQTRHSREWCRLPRPKEAGRQGYGNPRASRVIRKGWNTDLHPEPDMTLVARRDHDVLEPNCCTVSRRAA